ncbi:tyrosine-protein phosphatase [Isobaculum melis]|uniref:tyrosine-protein phosphatase n=1 Tax=Isobaculum melis TaxID=142588 RepID=UPI000AF74B40|nr:tyrosine-protein phosphatase [Isobaculum melis]
MVERFKVEKNEQNEYIFTTEKKQDETVTVFLTTSNDVKAAQKKQLIVTTASTFTLTLEAISERPYFIIEQGAESYVIATRNVDVPHMNNFRDMGGYATESGQHIKWGMLYRSDQICNANDAGLKALNQLGIRTIIDYRSLDEIEKYPNPTINPAVTTYHLDPNAHAAELSAQFQASKEDEDKNLIASIIEQKNKGALVDRYDIVMEQYNNFVSKEKSKAAFGKMLKVVANPEAAPIDQHCRGGKDRTGFGAMLVLGVLGVSKEEIVADYMLTYQNRVKRNETKMALYKKLTQDEDVLNYLYSLIETRAEFIETSYDKIIKEYGTMSHYATTELGLTDVDIANMKMLYLE